MRHTHWFILYIQTLALLGTVPMKMEDFHAHVLMTGPDIGANTKSDVTTACALMKQHVLKLLLTWTGMCVILPLMT